MRLQNICHWTLRINELLCKFRAAKEHTPTHCMTHLNRPLLSEAMRSSSPHLAALDPHVPASASARGSSTGLETLSMEGATTVAAARVEECQGLKLGYSILTFQLV